MKINQNARFNIDIVEYYNQLKKHAENGEFKAYWKLVRCTMSANTANLLSDLALNQKRRAHRAIKQYNDELVVIEFKRSVEKYSNKI